jgi:hypothetical protein
VPTDLSEEWILRYSPIQLHFLAKVVCFQNQNGNALDLEAHLSDERWKLEGVDFVDSVLHWLLGDEAHPLLTGIEALIFVSGEYAVSSEVVAYTIQHLFMYNEFLNSIQAYTTAKRVQEQLNAVGLLQQVEGKDTYRVSALVHCRTVKLAKKWLTEFAFDLKSNHSAFASHQLIRILAQAELYQDAIQMLEDEAYCTSRTKYLKKQAAQHHVNDCWLLLKAMYNAKLPHPSLEQACSQMAKQVRQDDGASFLVLGRFLCEQDNRTAALHLLNISIATATQSLKTELLLLAKSFKRVSTVYLCCELEDESLQYKAASMTLVCYNSNEGLESVLDAVTMHIQLEGKRTITSFGLEHQVARVDERVKVLAKGYFSTLALANHLVGNSSQATALDRVVELIRGPQVQFIRKMKNNDKKKMNAINSTKNEQSTNYWANVRHQVNMNISWTEKKE